MRLTITLSTTQKQPIIPVNYQYPLSAAIYKILEKGDSAYAEFLHESGYGKGFKLFCFSQINCPFLIYSDRLLLKRNELDFKVAFHLPLAAENFIKGLFQSEQLDIADKWIFRSKVHHDSASIYTRYSEAKYTSLFGGSRKGCLGIGWLLGYFPRLPFRHKVHQ